MAAKGLLSDGSTGLDATAGLLFSDRRKFYLDPQRVAELWSDISPFTTFLMNLPRKKVDDPLYKMFEHRTNAIKQEFTISTGSETIDASSGSESNALTVSAITGLNSTVNSSWHGLECEVWDSTKTTKKGVVIITSTPTDGVAGSGTIKVKNAKYSSGTGNDITTASGDYFIVIGNVRGEGSVAPEAWGDDLTMVWNSTQFFSTAVEVTGKLYRASLRGYNDELARLRMEKAKEFKMQREHAMLKSVSVLGTNMGSSDTFSEGELRTIADTESNNGYVRTTYGMVPILEDYGTTYTYGSTSSKDSDTNVFNILEGSYSYPDYVDDTEIIFDKTEGADQRFAFSGRGAMSYWNKIANGNYFSGKSGWTVQMDAMKQNKLGFNVQMLETPHGILYLTPTKALRNQYNKHMVIPDQNHVFLAEYEPDEFRNNIKTDNDYDGVKDVYRADQGLGVELIEKHHMIAIK